MLLFSTVSYLAFEAVKRSGLKSVTPGFVVLEHFQQPLSLVQVYVCLQPAEGHRIGVSGGPAANAGGGGAASAAGPTPPASLAPH